MPEMTFTVRWPDGAVQECYSPSLVIHDHLQPETSYTVGEFSRRATEALDEAAERVRAKFGFACTSAAATADDIRAAAVRYPTESMVEVVTMHPPLPIT
ncbi:MULTISPECIES: MSMEG_0570 family nitrogen starvation response protein [unclassified Gordonia (in: high G+C Gram-positive bacteria)]|uniref:MSMEG_0570 family nitrogen starvation response protein n=1 Tax=unclassified Gordonia (in: high G+C Gram-positive bacteria) TaxID=2657482 RepID=UPI001F0E6C12|nr:MSMEG_0570 family nitrogen starvation response protein [Gordonia sp. ABSL49_1]MCH5641153.1 MSMEG_0570 family nitrogen starvation response protein [Gordonia sp. ABSL49_1]